MNVFYAISIGFLTLLGAGLAGHLAAKEWWHKWIFWGSATLILILIYFQARSSKEPPTVEDISNGVVNKLRETHNVQTVLPISGSGVPPVTSVGAGQNKSVRSEEPVTHKSLPKKSPTFPPTSAHLSVTQSQKTSTRPDAAVETEIVIQTDVVFPTLKLVMQCDQPLVDAQPTLGGTAGMVQMLVSSGIVTDHPNVVVYSYGSSIPPFGPANPVVIDVWSKQTVTCNQVSTF
jgi:hypothetical protein